MRLMQFVLVCCLLTGHVWSARAETADAEKGEWIQLFNGKNLDGWTPKIRGYEVGDNFADTFRVEDGLLKVSYDKYEGKFQKRFGHLYYKEPFSHYVLRVEYRIVGEQMPGAPGWAFRNSGVMFHGQTPQSMALDQEFPVCLEAQLLSGDGRNKRSTANLCTPGTYVVMDGKLNKNHCINSTSQTYHGEVWVTAELEVHGSKRIRHKIDGKTVLEYSQSQLDENDRDAKKLLAAGAPKMLGQGTISLQSEGHPVEFRKVELRKLAN
ncbi:MAG: DUF1080 domain-containing protein [Pirellulales bacterium]|nr:DUF1080 domain-containing protein [Pirellulales bacterium]